MFLCYCAAISEAYSRIAKSFTGTKTNFKCILVQTLTVSAQENVFVSCLLFIFRADLSVYPYPVLGYMQRNLCSHHCCTKVFAFSFDYVL